MHNCIFFLGEESRMGEINCEISSRVSRGLGCEKVWSFAGSGAHQDLGFISCIDFMHKIAFCGFCTSVASFII